MAIKTDKFLESVKRRVTVPANQALLSDAAILSLGDECVQLHLVPILMSAQQSYLVYHDTYPITADLDTYPIPYRAVGRGLRELKLSWDGTTTGVRNLTYIEIEDRHRYAESGTPVGYYFEGDKIVLVPTPTDSTQLLLRWFEVAPNKLILPTAASVVLSVTPGVTTTDVVVDAVATDITVAAVVDFIEAKSGNTLLGMDKTVANIAGTTLTFAVADVPSSLAVGDYIALAGYSPVVQVPNEALLLLETLTARMILEAIGDFDGAGILKDREKELIDNFRKLIEPRNPGSPKKIVNQSGLLRGKGYAIYSRRSFF